MVMELKNNNTEYFEQINIDNLKRLDLGPYKFENESNRLAPVYDLIKEMLGILNKYSDIPEIFSHELNNIISEFNEICKQILEFKVNTNLNENVAAKKRPITDLVNTYFNKVFRGGTFLGPGNVHMNPNNLLTYYNVLKNYSFLEIKKSKADIDDLVEKGKVAYSKFENALTDIQKEAGKVTTEKYAKIFEEQSDEHKKASNRWLYFGIGLTFILFLAVIFLKHLFPYSEDSTNSQINLINYLFTKVSILFILIFLTTYAFKQFSINKHLYTINKHRRNTLNSYNIFIQSIKGEDQQQTINLLMLEVARTIFEQNRTGYLSDKGNEIETPSSIIELTKLITNTTKAI